MSVFHETVDLKSLFRHTWNTNSDSHIAKMKIKSLHRYLLSDWINAIFARRIQKYCLRKARQILKISKTYFPILELPLNLIWSLSKAKIKSSDGLIICMKLWNPKFDQEKQNRFSQKTRQSLTLLKNVLSILELNIGTKLKNVKFHWRIQNHFFEAARHFSKFLFILEFLINFFWSLPKAEF